VTLIYKSCNTNDKWIIFNKSSWNLWY